MFDEFELCTVDVGEVRVRARCGGSGPPLLLLHGHPQTHLMWHRVAPRLARDFTVVAPDLRGYGGSSAPPPAPDHAPYAKRAMAQDQIALMRHLGHERFAVVGHDRGGRVAYRLALDHPQRVTRLAVLDIVPTAEAFGRADMAFGLGYWNWFFLAQPAPLPERLIGADPAYFYGRYFDAAVNGTPREAFAPEALAEYLACAARPETIHAMCEDYRAGATADYAHDAADRAAGRRIACPVLALWSGRGALARWYDVLAVWRGWADDVRGGPLDAGHFLAEEAPDAVHAELRPFLTAC